MSDRADLLLAEAQLLARSIEMFPFLEVSILVIALVLTRFFVRNRARAGAGTSPLTLILVAGTVLLFSAVFAHLWGLNHTLLALAYGIAIPLSALDSVTGVAFLVANTIIRPWEMSGIEAMSFVPKTLFLLALGSWVVQAARRRRLSILLSRPCQYYYGLAGWLLLSAMNSGDFLGGLAKYQGSIMIATVVFFLLTNGLWSRPDVEIVKRTTLLAVTGLIGHALLSTILQPDYDPAAHRLEDAGTLGNANDLAAMIALVLPLALVPLLRRSVQLRDWVIGIVTIPPLLAGLWISQSRGAMLAIAVAGVGYLAFRARNRRLAIILSIAAVPFLVALPMALNFAREADDLEGSTNSRKAFMIAGLNMGLRNPIFGVGFDNFSSIWDRYAIGQTFETGQRSAHNTWLLAFAENGFPGLLLLVGLFFTTFKVALRIRDQHPDLLASLLGYGVAMTFLAHVYTIYPYLLFALILGAARV